MLGTERDISMQHKGAVRVSMVPSWSSGQCGLGPLLINKTCLIKSDKRLAISLIYSLTRCTGQECVG